MPESARCMHCCCCQMMWGSTHRPAAPIPGPARLPRLIPRQCGGQSMCCWVWLVSRLWICLLHPGNTRGGAAILSTKMPTTKTNVYTCFLYSKDNCVKLLPLTACCLSLCRRWKRCAAGHVRNTKAELKEQFQKAGLMEMLGLMRHAS
jgi:hypothetical protein